MVACKVMNVANNNVTCKWPITQLNLRWVQALADTCIAALWGPERRIQLNHAQTFDTEATDDKCVLFQAAKLWQYCSFYSNY